MTSYGESYIGPTSSWPSSISISRPAPSISAPAAEEQSISPGVLEALKKAVAFYEPGGAFGKGTEAALERGRTKAVSSGMQNLVSAGLAGTTVAGGLGKKYEEEVAAPTRLKAEETRAGKLSDLAVLEAQITQGANEAARSRALQKYLAQLQSSTQMQLANMRQPSVVQRAQPTQQATEQGGYGASFGGVGDSYSPARPAMGYGAGGAYVSPSSTQPTTSSLQSLADQWLSEGITAWR